MHSFEPCDPEELLAELVHDLRQPLGNIQTSAFYMDLLLHHPEGPVQEQLHLIEQQVAAAARLLAEAAAQLRRQRPQPMAAESLVRTNSATVGVT